MPFAPPVMSVTFRLVESGIRVGYFGRLDGSSERPRLPGSRTVGALLQRRCTACPLPQFSFLMNRNLIPLIALLVATALPAGAQTPSDPPMAKKQPVDLTTHGITRSDPYYWLREREDPEVIAYLNAENAFTAEQMAHLQGLEGHLFEEMVGRIKQDDSSVPYRDNGYWYYTRYEEGQEYPIYARKKGSLDAEEQILLNVNELAEGHGFYQVMGLSVSEDGKMLAFGTDTVGRRIATLRFKNLETGEMLDEEIYPMTGNVVWANDNQTVFYGRQDLGTLRSYQILRHTLGTDPATDEVVFQEDDTEFRAFVTKAKSDRYLFIGAAQTLSTEWRYLDADDPDGTWQTFAPRERNHEYSIDHFGDHFYVHTNEGGATNFKLMRAPVAATDRANWETVIPHREDVLIEGFEIFRDFLVLDERARGLTQLRIRPWDGSGEHYIDFGEPTYTAYTSVNRDFDTDVLRYGYASLTTPTSTYDYNMKTREKTLLKRDEVRGGFSPEDYVTERVYATAPDGVQVPISLVYRKELQMDGSNPLLLYGYGSYGNSIDAGFSSVRLSLLDRGFVYAIAHIRGGQEMGRQWYDEGKLMKKMNTFTDFIAAGEYLAQSGYADPERLYAMGGSAGGLLMGAVINLRPDLFHGVVAAVPFVDVVTTMLDDSIPLTTFEYDEWGNPNDEEAFRYMLSYSPYDNVEAKEYPNMLVTTGLHDSQVQYWEPAKWVAKLRDVKTDGNRLLLKTNMEAGHGGASGRFQRFREIATEYAFLLDLAGMASVPIMQSSEDSN